MPARSLKIGIPIVTSAFFIGVAGDTLLRITPWGANVAIFVTIAVITLVFLLRLFEHGPGLFPWLSVPVIFAEFFAVRDSTFLKFSGFLAIVGAFFLIVYRHHRGRILNARIWDYATGALHTAANIAIGPLLLACGDFEWGQLTRDRSVRRLGSVATGMVLAIPLLLTFGPLLVAADPVFASMVDTTFDFDFPKITSHLLLASFIAWISAGYLRGVFLARQADPQWLDGTKAPRLGIVEIGIALGSLAFLFLVFVAVQARYLFGGEQMVQATIGLHYAEYARRGFFELVTATALILPVLLVADWAMDHKTEQQRRSFVALAAVIVVLVVMIMISAFRRMSLYVQAYGLTADRFYATAFMFWIAAVLAWFAATVLRGFRNRFAFGALASGFVMLATLNILNPEALIARSNLARVESGRDLDVEYLLTLSADAAPTLLSGLSSLPEPERCELEAGIRETQWAKRIRDWRSWNLTHARALRALEQNRAHSSCDQSRSSPARPSPRSAPTS